MKRYTTLTRCALLTAAALIISLLENFIPIPIPGVKLGIANAVTLYLLLYHSPLQAFGVLTARLLLAALIAGNPASLIYAALGGYAAFGVSTLAKRSVGTFLSPIGLSILGAAAHHIGQLGGATFVTGSGAVWSYLPILLLCSIVTGAVTGVLCTMVYKRINKNS